MPSIEILSAILCEDVRQEASGQAVLIGAAPVGPSVKKDAETTIQRLFFYIEAISSEVATVYFRLISDDDEDIIMDVSIDMEGDDVDGSSNTDDVSNYIVWVFGRQGVKFNKAGVYKLKYSVENDEWNDIRKFVFPARDDE